MTDLFSNFYPSLESPAENAAAVTPSDADDLPFATRSIYVGGEGDLTCVMVNADSDGDITTFVGASAGTVLPLRVRRIMSTNTTATNIVAVW